MVGHGMIWNGQAKVREKSRQYARVDMEDTDDLAWEIDNGLEDLNAYVLSVQRLTWWAYVMYVTHGNPSFSFESATKVFLG